FLRRCFFHYIRFPDTATMTQIVDVHFPGLKRDLLHETLTTFFKIRETPGLKKKPTTSELLDWIKLLVAEEIPPEVLRSDDAKKLIPPLYGALLKNEQDVHLFEQLVFLKRRNARYVLFSAAQDGRAGLDHRSIDVARSPQSRFGGLDRGAILLPGANLFGEGREVLRSLRS